MLHRRVTIAGFAADLSWSKLQRDPTLDLTAATGLVAPIVTTRPGTLLWWGVGYNGNTGQSVAVDGTGATFDAQLVYKRATDGNVQTPFEFLRLTSIGETLLAEVEFGRPPIDLDLPFALEGWIQMIALTAAGAATHLNLSFEFVPKDL